MVLSLSVIITKLLTKNQSFIVQGYSTPNIATLLKLNRGMIMKRVLFILSLAGILSSKSFAIDKKSNDKKLNDKKSSEARTLKCLDKIITSKKIDRKAVTELTSVIDQIYRLDAEQALSDCRQLRKRTKKMKKLSYYGFNNVFETAVNANLIDEKKAKFIYELAYPRLNCTITGFSAKAGLGMGLGAGVYAGNCEDKFGRVSKALMPSLIGSISIGAAVSFETLDVYYDAGKNIPDNEDIVYSVAFTQKHCAGFCNGRGLSVGLYAGINGQLFIPIRIKKGALDNQVIMENWY